MKSTDKDVNRLIREAMRAGASVGYTGKSHVKVSAPGCRPVIVSCSPSHGALDKVKKQMRHLIATLGG